MEPTEPFEDLLNKSERLNRALAVINHAYSVLIHSQTEQELYSGPLRQDNNASSLRG